MSHEPLLVPTYYDARPLARVASVVEHDPAVDDNGVDPDRILKWIREGGAIGHRGGIEDDEIGGEPCLDQSAVGEMELPRGEPGHLVDGLLERDDMLFPDVFAQDARECAEISRMRHTRAERAARRERRAVRS